MAAAADPRLMALLAGHRSLGSAPPSEHAWLVAHGAPRRLAAGEVIVRAGEASESLWVVFSGHIVIRVDRGAGSHKLFEWRGGDVGGLLPFSRGAKPPSDAAAEEQTELLVVEGVHLPGMVRECPVMTEILVHAMVDRARHFNASDLRDEKLLSLGRLAAGLAHELNNPAAAAVRSARLLAEHLDAAEAAALTVGAAQLTGDQLAVLGKVRSLCAREAEYSVDTPLARADREDAISGWLADHGASEECAAPLAETGVTLAALDRLAAAVGGDALDASLRWMSAGCQVRALASDLQVAASRIFELVDSVKRFTYMDHAPTAEPVDIRRGIRDTLTMLAASARAKSVHLVVEFAEDLPLAQAVGGELNQVWMNLLDNAIDAVAVGGRVTVTAQRLLDRLLVDVADDGPGIAPANLDRIFEPFFTTKGVGGGAGVGLAIVQRVLRQHGGEIEVASRPGATRFRVTLPLAPGQGVT